MTSAFPTVAQLAVQSHLGRTLGSPQPLAAITAFADHARSLQPMLTDKGAMVLYVASKCPDVTAKDLEDALSVRHSVLWAVLKGLAVELKLISVTGTGWIKAVALSVAGIAFVSQVKEASNEHRASL